MHVERGSNNQFCRVSVWKAGFVLRAWWFRAQRPALAIVFSRKTLYSFVQAPTLPHIKVHFWSSAKNISKCDGKVTFVHTEICNWGSTGSNHSSFVQVWCFYVCCCHSWLMQSVGRWFTGWLLLGAGRPSLSCYSKCSLFLVMVSGGLEGTVCSLQGCHKPSSICFSNPVQWTGGPPKSQIFPSTSNVQPTGFWLPALLPH